MMGQPQDPGLLQQQQQQQQTAQTSGQQPQQVPRQQTPQQAQVAQPQQGVTVTVGTPVVTSQHLPQASLDGVQKVLRYAVFRPFSMTLRLIHFLFLGRRLSCGDSGSYFGSCSGHPSS